MRLSYILEIPLVIYICPETDESSHENILKFPILLHVLIPLKVFASAHFMSWLTMPGFFSLYFICVFHFLEMPESIC